MQQLPGSHMIGVAATAAAYNPVLATALNAAQVSVPQSVGQVAQHAPVAPPAASKKRKEGDSKGRRVSDEQVAENAKVFDDFKKIAHNSGDELGLQFLKDLNDQGIDIPAVRNPRSDQNLMHVGVTYGLLETVKWLWERQGLHPDEHDVNGKSVRELADEQRKSSTPKPAAMAICNFLETVPSVERPRAKRRAAAAGSKIYVDRNYQSDLRRAKMESLNASSASKGSATPAKRDNKVHQGRMSGGPNPSSGPRPTSGPGRQQRMAVSSNKASGKNQLDEKKHEEVAQKLDEWLGQLSDLYQTLTEMGQAGHAKQVLELLRIMHATFEQVREDPTRVTPQVQTLLKLDIPARIVASIDGFQGLSGVEGGLEPQIIAGLQAVAEYSALTSQGEPTLTKAKHEQEAACQTSTMAVAKYNNELQQIDAHWAQEIVPAQNELDALKAKLQELEAHEKKLQDEERVLARQIADCEAHIKSKPQPQGEALGRQAEETLQVAAIRVAMSVEARGNAKLQAMLEQEQTWLTQTSSDMLLKHVAGTLPSPESANSATLRILCKDLAKRINMALSLQKLWPGGLPQEASLRAKELLVQLKEVRERIVTQWSAKERKAWCESYVPPIERDAEAQMAITGFFHDNIDAGIECYPVLNAYIGKLAEPSENGEMVEYTTPQIQDWDTDMWAAVDAACGPYHRSGGEQLLTKPSYEPYVRSAMGIQESMTRITSGEIRYALLHAVLPSAMWEAASREDAPPMLGIAVTMARASLPLVRKLLICDLRAGLGAADRKVLARDDDVSLMECRDDMTKETLDAKLKERFTSGFQPDVALVVWSLEEMCAIHSAEPEKIHTNLMITTKSIAEASQRSQTGIVSVVVDKLGDAEVAFGTCKVHAEKALQEHVAYFLDLAKPFST